MLRAAVAKIVAVNGGHDDVTQTHIGDSLREFLRFVGIRGHRTTVRLSLIHILKGGSGCGDLIHIKHFVNDILFFIQIAPVSYTHLDVYKRQSLRTSSSSSAGRRW